MADRAPARRPTIYDVAQAAGVSKSLVSLVLQDSPLVSPARRAAVEKAIRRLNYRPSQAAARLAGSRSRTIGVLLEDYRNLWYVELLRGLQDELGPSGFRVAVQESSLNAHVDPSPVDGLLDLRVEGLVIAMEPSADMVRTGEVPTVVAGSRDVDLAGAGSVANDDRLGGRLATEHLLELGHRRVVHVTGAGGSARLRSEGYADAMTSAGLEPTVLKASGTTEADGYALARQVLEPGSGVTAVFAGNDTMAMGVVAVARERGLEVPRDLSLVGYDDSPLAATQLLRLTTVDGRSREVGAHAARTLLARIADPDTPPDLTRIPPLLVVRSTVGPPAGFPRERGKPARSR